MSFFIQTSVIKPLLAGLAAGLFSLSLAAFADAPSTGQGAQPVDAKAAKTVTVYKNPNCGCCTGWNEHIEANGFVTRIEHPADLDGVKSRYGVLPLYRSCHLAVSNSGYVFEGHVPAKVMHQFLREKPAGAIGLAVPGMPVGSPGMEVKDRFQPYQVLLLKDDGSAEVYSTFHSYREQF